MSHYEHSIKSIDELIPYAMNSRTHSDQQVSQIAASIKEFGFTNPILIDEKGGIIAGHGRVMAAKKLALDEVPCIRFESLSKSAKKNGVKDVLCSDCGTEFSVRKDTKPVVCQRCASSRGGRAAKGIYQAERKECKNDKCKKPIRKTLKDKYCSIECRKDDKRLSRKCKQCSADFQVLKSSMNTNASGNFCSRGCYESFMCNSDKKTGRGSQWSRSRLDALKRIPFCVMCGKTSRLDVHHLIPFRLTQDNSQENLIPLCKKHHRLVEHQTNCLINSGVELPMVRQMIKASLKDFYLVLCKEIRRLKNAA